ncbi:MAG TPA: hypothetical protein DIU15_07615, partial [Deltaproteobacteria bacterium]|nr:hypothetical protein [Deltaproteobacteria bacterium]
GAGDDDTSPATSNANYTELLCASGGAVSSADISGFLCLSPVEVSTQPSAAADDGSITWAPGPTRLLAQ